jgi:general secretion pathway protein B
VSGAAEPSPRPQREPRAGVDRPPADTVVSAPPSTPPSPPSLLDALAKMKLEIFVYTDVSKDRMVIINGRKYAEGEQVDGLYLLEAITREGAVLTYQGERALLQP